MKADIAQGNMQGLIAGAKMVETMYGQLASDSADCEAAKGDIGLIINWFSIFNNPVNAI